MKKNDKKKVTLWVVVSLLILIIAGLTVWNINQRKEMEEMVDLMSIEKEELEEQYEDLYIQFDGYQQLDIRNDSLQDQLTREQQRVQDLLEELRQTKASNARKITELKNELATLREISQNLVKQIDSLSKTNAFLTEENRQVKLENKQFKQENTQLTNQNNELKETVSRASMLEITGFSLTMLDKNDRKTSLLRKLSKLQFNFEIAKNITCKPGMKDLYACIMDPEGNLLGENEENTFRFENGNIPYTLTQQFEYAGEEYKGVCYYALSEEDVIQKGYYSIDFFCDGNMIGSFPFQLKK